MNPPWPAERITTLPGPQDIFIWVSSPLEEVKSWKPMDVEIIVWKKADWLQIAAFFETMKKDHPNSSSVAVAYHEANLRYEADETSRKTSERIEEARKRWEEEKEKSAVLSRQLEDKEKRERALMGKLAEGAKIPPVILCGFAQRRVGNRSEGGAALRGGPG